VACEASHGDGFNEAEASCASEVHFFNTFCVTYNPLQ